MFPVFLWGKTLIWVDTLILSMTVLILKEGEPYERSSPILYIIYVFILEETHFIFIAAFLLLK